jgi:hypothetical protein
VLLAAGQRRGELDDRVAAVVGAADQARVEERGGQEAAQQPLGLVVAERLTGCLVLDQLDPVEVPVAADVADDRQVAELLERGAERRLVRADVAEQVLLLEDVQVGQGDRAADRVAGERDPVQERGRLVGERLDQPVASIPPSGA